MHPARLRIHLYEPGQKWKRVETFYGLTRFHCFRNFARRTKREENERNFEHIP